MRLQHVVSQQLRRLQRRYSFLRRVSIATTALTLIWLYTITWGERSVYKSYISACAWKKWEEWPKEASPHHLVFIADPQLVDPHTYPGRPWPLSALTEQYTDLYMSRNFRLINEIIDPDSVIFLGDLFDGGREWAPEKPKKLKASQRKRLEDLGIMLPQEGEGNRFRKRSMSTYQAALSRPHSHSITPEDHNIGKDGRDLKEFVPGENGRWSKWGNKQWLQEFRRFSRIFFDPAQLYPVQDRKFFAVYDVTPDPVSIQNGADAITWQEYATLGGKQRRVLTSLPGNHDLGFGPGVQLAVRNRFQSHFGESNRIDVIGNHTFVSLDSLSLAAHSYYRDDGYETGEEQDEHRYLWIQGMQFLENMRVPARKAVTEALEEYYPRPKSSTPRWHHEVVEPTELIEKPSIDELADELMKPRPNLPVILLSHVPLFRPAGTECGKLRERGNSIRIAMGYQYQNVLTQSLSKDIVTKISENAGDIVNVFSGDDHDYCDVVHRYNIAPDFVDIIKTKLKHIREVTVKSFSWAMGVRRPGFLLVSLWNPVDAEGLTIGTPLPTVQTHLCLLPDQLNIFIDYALLLLLTLAILVADSVYAVFRGTHSTAEHYYDDIPPSPLAPARMTLPRFHLDTNSNGNVSVNSYTAKPAVGAGRQRGTSTSSSSHSRNNSTYLGVQRSYNARTRSVSPSGPGVGFTQPTGGLIDQAGYFPSVKWTDPEDEDGDEEVPVSSRWREDSKGKWKWRRRARLPPKVRGMLEEFGVKLCLVGFVGVVWYGFLLRNG